MGMDDNGHCFFLYRLIDFVSRDKRCQIAPAIPQSKPLHNLPFPAVISHCSCPHADSGSKKQVSGKVVAILAAIAMFSANSFLRGEAPAENSAISGLPKPVTKENFAALKNQSPFLRSIGLSKSIVLTGIARMEEGVFATLFDLETRESYLVGKKANPEGWQLVGINGDQSNLETLTARVKIAGSEVVSIRYEKLSAKVFNSGVSIYRGRKRRGDGTGPHGGPDPRMLTQEQMTDAKNGARNYHDGFKADGYADNTKLPASTIAKLSKLSTQQREKINVKMYEYRNRGLGMPERQKIYENMLDKTVRSSR